MQKETRKKLALAAVVLLAPGGFVLGAALVAKHIRRNREQAQSTDSPSDAG